MNPFDLSGPAFLLFYLLFCAAVTLAFLLALALLEHRQTSPLPLDDPYRIAWLAGGGRRVAQVAILSLFNRGQLSLVGKTLVRQPGPAMAGHRLERAVWDATLSEVKVDTVLRDSDFRRGCDALRQSLIGFRLVPDTAANWRRGALLAAALLLVLGVAVAKIDLAVARGKTNFLFLLLLSGVAALILMTLALRRRTGSGDAALRDLKHLVRRANIDAVIRRGTAVDETMLLAAVFGMSALRGPIQEALRYLFLSSRSPNGSSCGSSCSSGSSSGCGGGSGCGGCSSG